MKVIYNDIIPFPGYKCMNLFGVIFARKGAHIDDVTINHERIHTEQYKEVTSVALLVWVILAITAKLWWLVFFAPLTYYAWYVIEWVVRLFTVKRSHRAYRRIAFEQEAYANEDNRGYIEERAWFSFLKYY